MKHIKVKMSALLFALVLTACSMLGRSRSQVMQVKAGMTREAVVALLGQPETKRFNPEIEEWAYSVLGDYNWYVHFQQGRVVALTQRSIEVVDRPSPPVRDIEPMPRPLPPNVGREGRYSDDYETDFEELYTSISREMFDKEKYAKLETVARYSPFTVAQCLRLMRLFSFNRERLQVLRILAPALIDRHRAYQIYDAFTFRSEKLEAQRIIEAATPRYSYVRERRYSSDMERSFDDFYRRVQRESFDRDKYALLESAARHTPFTVGQCVQLMRLFSFDRERLRVLRILAPALIDRHRAYQIYDSFSFSGERAEAKRIVEGATPRFQSSYYRGEGRRTRYSREDFDALYNSTQGLLSMQDRLSYLAGQLGAFEMSALECQRLLGLFPIESDRLRALELLTPFVYNKAEMPKVLGTLPSIGEYGHVIERLLRDFIP